MKEKLAMEVVSAEANKEMMNLRAKIGVSKNYKITAKYEDGIIVGLTISENSK